MKHILTLIILMIFIFLTSCAAQPTGAPVPISTEGLQADMPNPASAFCVEQGYKSEIRTAADGSQSGYCIFTDGSECEEWAYFRGECKPNAAKGIFTALPINDADYQGWWTYTHAVYGFSIMLPDGWVVNEITSNDAVMNGHTLALRGQVPTNGTENIRMTFRRLGEDTPLWPTGVGPGEFIQQGTLDIADQPAQRILLVCPTGEVTSIWYHDADGKPNITRGDLEFAFIFQTESHCAPGHSLSGKTQHMGEMIIASLKVP
jgi:putative hemolysin